VVGRNNLPVRKKQKRGLKRKAGKENIQIPGLLSMKLYIYKSLK
jgi:hypothetical protein